MREHRLAGVEQGIDQQGLGKGARARQDLRLHGLSPGLREAEHGRGRRERAKGHARKSKSSGG